MILMALDHVSHYWSPTPFDPTDIELTTPAWFATRWVTHICAPVFVFLAGTSAWFKGRKVGTEELSRWLVVRGLWIVLLEVVVNNTIWFASAWFSFGGFMLSLQVLWAIGVSMIFLGFLCRLPRGVVAAVALAMIAGHNLLDGVGADAAGSSEPLDIAWSLLHAQSFIGMGAGADGGPSWSLMILYPLIPWIGVMAAGWCFGGWFTTRVNRARSTFLLGLGLCAAFLALRFADVYGEPSRWGSSERGALYTALDFLNCSKYPPSLLFLLMTLGPALMCLGWFEHLPERALKRLVVYGRVPLFFYLVHMIVIHAMALVAAAADERVAAWWFTVLGGGHVEGYEPSISRCYHVWVMVVLVLYPACYVWGLFKASGRHRWADWL